MTHSYKDNVRFWTSQSKTLFRPFKPYSSTPTDWLSSKYLSVWTSRFATTRCTLVPCWKIPLNQVYVTNRMLIVPKGDSIILTLSNWLIIGLILQCQDFFDVFPNGCSRDRIQTKSTKIIFLDLRYWSAGNNNIQSSAINECWISFCSRKL